MSYKPIEELFFPFFEGTLSNEERQRVEKWRGLSEENRQILADSYKVWSGTEQIKLMRKYDSQKALLKVNSVIEQKSKFKIWNILQKAAAILILPLLAVTFWLLLVREPLKLAETTHGWHTLEIPSGMRSQFFLPDSTKVYLNSKSTLSYPLYFNDEIREIKLSGEAYFEVAENKEVPFVVNTGRINIEVTGTEFLVTNYQHENLTEIVLIKGSVKLFQGEYFSTKKDIVQLTPGEKATSLQGDKNLRIEKVHTDKYLAWKEGMLVFRDDPMIEVVRRLNRWYNVDIQLEGEEIKDWTYTAIFEDESLEQVLELLKISAPIDYSIKRRELKTDKTFSNMEIVIRQN